jgi:two-component system nitrate/nitrite response regulator NarL
MEIISVIVADDHAGVRSGLISLLTKNNNQIEVVGETKCGAETVHLCQQISPTVLLLDFRLPDMDGSQVACQLQSSGSTVRILSLSAYIGPEFKNIIQKLLDCGVAGFITKDEVIEWLIPAVCSIAQGEKWLSPTVQKYLSNGDFLPR